MRGQVQKQKALLNKITQKLPEPTLYLSWTKSQDNVGDTALKLFKDPIGIINSDFYHKGPDLYD